jgi:organic radical activating enzyme
MVKIAEIFRSTQGEGRNAGCAAVFVRLSGCNLKCPFCDTDHSGKEMDESAVAHEVMELRKDADIDLVIFTGGEPSLQLKSMETIIKKMYGDGYIGTFAVESNGTCKPGEFRAIGVDFVTISPKCLWVSNPAAAEKFDSWADASEIKCLFDTTKNPQELRKFLDDVASSVASSGSDAHLYLQPITDHKDDAMTQKNIRAVLHYITHEDSRWAISMQLQNIWNVR